MNWRRTTPCSRYRLGEVTAEAAITLNCSPLARILRVNSLSSSTRWSSRYPPRSSNDFLVMNKPWSPNRMKSMSKRVTQP